jgi:hypothetical protein
MCSLQSILRPDRRQYINERFRDRIRSGVLLTQLYLPIRCEQPICELRVIKKEHVLQSRASPIEGGEGHRCRLSCPLYQCSELRREEYSSCILCRSRKIRCDRGTPCSNCLKSRNGTCVYRNSPSHSPHQQHHLAQEPGASQYPTPSSNISRGSIAPSHPSSTSVTSSTNASTRANQPLSRDIDFLESIDRQPED